MRTTGTVLFAAIVALPISASAQLPPYVPQDDLVGWWPFTGNAEDIGGNAHHGTSNGAVLAADRFGTADRAYAFNGTSNYIEVADAPALRFGDASYAIAWWALVNTYNANATAFVVKRGTGPQNGWMVVANGLYENKIEMKTSSGTDPEIRCDTALATGSWFHFAIVHDADVDSIIFFANGTEVFRQSSGGLYYNPSSTAPMRFGSDTSIPAGTYFLSGAMDDIGIWGRRLTAQEVLDLYLNTNVGIGEPSAGLPVVTVDAAARQLQVSVAADHAVSPFELFDASGRVVLSGRLNGARTVLSVHGFPPGSYALRCMAISPEAARFVLP
ncbi:MAG TPA: LamG domain-containing protein [Flavobacteriales bacterium]|nr:LamG domain-containing protein [Flavobacteriales bacterium]